MQLTRIEIHFIDREALAFTSIGRVRHVITSEKLVSEFETNVAVIPGLPVILKGTITSTANIESIANGTITLIMDKVTIKQGSSNFPFLSKVFENIEGLNIRSLGNYLETAITDYKNPMPVFRSYYFDEKFRICRDQDDNIFVYLKSDL